MSFKKCINPQLILIILISINSIFALCETEILFDRAGLQKYPTTLRPELVTNNTNNKLLFDATVLCEFDKSIDTLGNFKQLLAYFDKKDEEAKRNDRYHKTTEVGDYVPSSLILAYFGFNYLISGNLIDVSQLFCDAGCGDGRIVRLMADVFGMASIGVEYDAEIAGLAKGNVQDPSSILEGDFTKDETYLKNGLYFKDIGVWFNFINNHISLAKKIAKESKSGTILVVYNISSEPAQYPGLSLIGKVKIVNKANIKPVVDLSDLNAVNPPIRLEPEDAYLYVYIKGDTTLTHKLNNQAESPASMLRIPLISQDNAKAIEPYKNRPYFLIEGDSITYQKPDNTDVILPKEIFGGREDINLAKIIEDACREVIGDDFLISFTGSIIYARDINGNIDWDLINSDIDIRVSTDILLDIANQDKILEEIYNKIKTLGSKYIYLQRPPYESSIYFMLNKEDIAISLGFATLDQLFNDFKVEVLRFDRLTPESYVLVPSYFFFGNINLLNQYLNSYGKEHLLRVMVKWHTQLLSKIKAYAAAIKDVSPYAQADLTENNLIILKRLYELAYARGREKEVKFLLEKYKEYSTNKRGLTLDIFNDLYERALQIIDQDKEGLIADFERYFVDTNKAGSIINKEAGVSL